MGYQELIGPDARALRTGDIVVLPPEPSGARRRLRLATSSLSRIHISVGETSRSDNDVDLAHAVFTAHPEDPSVLFVSGATHEDDHSYEEDNLFTPSGRLIATRAYMVPVRPYSLASGDPLIRVPAAAAFSSGLAASPHTFGLVELLDATAKALGYTLDCSPDTWFNALDAVTTCSHRDFVMRMCGDIERSSSSVHVERNDLKFLPDVHSTYPHWTAAETGFYRLAFSCWASNCPRGPRKKHVLSVDKDAVAAMVDRGMKVYRPDAEEMKKILSPVFANVTAFVADAYRSAADILEKAIVTFDAVFTAEKSSVVETRKFIDACASPTPEFPFLPPPVESPEPQGVTESSAQDDFDNAPF